MIDLPDWWPRFEAKFELDETSGCWLWTAATQSDGYGQFWLSPRVQLAHRVAYELLVGPIPEGLELDHVRARGRIHRHCVNPAHLEPVTKLENQARGKKATKTHCKRGHEFTPENTYRRPRGGRACRTCVRFWVRGQYQRKAR